MTKITHIITGLNTGGAEMMLYKLLSRMDRTAFENKVVSLTDVGPVGQKIQALGVPVRPLGMCRGLPDPRGLFRLSTWIRKDSSSLIQTWMYHADLIGGLASKLARKKQLVWNIRHTNLDPKMNKRGTLLTVLACARLSGVLPAVIVCCSEASKNVHTALGYSSGKMVVIPNGFDLETFRPNPAAYQSVRSELGISGETLLIGLIGRFDPQKDHQNFVQAVSLFHRQRADVQFLLCGDGITWENSRLAGLIKSSGVSGHFHLLGRRDDIPRLTAALDIASSSSYGEGFPNVIGEAMACGVPCVVTDVGDSALIVGNTGRIVPRKNPEALAAVWHDLINMCPEGRRALGLAERKRIEEHYSLPAIVARYEHLYEELGTRVRY